MQMSSSLGGTASPPTIHKRERGSGVSHSGQARSRAVISLGFSGSSLRRAHVSFLPTLLLFVFVSQCSADEVPFIDPSKVPFIDPFRG